MQFNWWRQDTWRNAIKRLRAIKLYCTICLNKKKWYVPRNLTWERVLQGRMEARKLESVRISTEKYRRGRKKEKESIWQSQAREINLGASFYFTTLAKVVEVCFLRRHKNGGIRSGKYVTIFLHNNVCFLYENKVAKGKKWKRVTLKLSIHVPAILQQIKVHRY